MGFINDTGFQHLTNKLVQGDAIKVASHRGHTVKNVIDNITRECENVSTPNTMTLENRVNKFRVGKGRDVDVSGDVEECKIGVSLQGKTWQNLLGGIKGTPSGTNVTNTIIDNGDNTITITRDEEPVNTHTGVFFDLNKGCLKENEKYTIIINIIENTLPNELMVVDSSYTGFTPSKSVKSKQTGIIRYLVTYTGTGADRWWIWSLRDTQFGKVTFSYPILLKGDYTQTPVEELPQYFEGIKSSFEDGLVDVDVQGKNLFDCDRELTNYGSTSYEKIPNGYRIKRDTPGMYSNSYIIMNLKPNTKYLIHSKYTLRTGSAMIIIKDKNNDSFPNRQEPFMSNNMVGSFVTPDDGVVRLGFACTTNAETVGDVDFYDILLQEYAKSSYSHYEPYYKKKISFNIGEPLRSLPNGVCDEIRNNNGQWELVRRVGKTILDGQTWRVYAYHLDWSSGDYYAAYTTKIGEQQRKKGSVDVIVDTLPVINHPNSVIYNGCITAQCCWAENYTYAFYTAIKKSNLESETFDGVNKWLQQNPTTVYYELETPIITPIEPMEFEVKPLATMTINSQISPVSNHTVVLNRAGQIEQGILKIAELRKRVDELETAYENQLIGTQLKLSLLTLDHELEKEEI